MIQKKVGLRRRAPESAGLGHCIPPCQPRNAHPARSSARPPTTASTRSSATTRRALPTTGTTPRPTTQSATRTWRWTFPAPAATPSAPRRRPSTAATTATCLAAAPPTLSATTRRPLVTAPSTSMLRFSESGWLRRIDGCRHAAAALFSPLSLRPEGQGGHTPASRQQDRLTPHACLAHRS